MTKKSCIYSDDLHNWHTHPHRLKTEKINIIIKEGQLFVCTCSKGSRALYKYNHVENTHEKTDIDMSQCLHSYYVF